MNRLFSFILAWIIMLTVNAASYSYHFKSMPLSEAIRKIAGDHPEIDINFIYNELENYQTNSIVNTDDPYQALRQTVGINPVMVNQVNHTFYVEALQHGKYVYSGTIIGADKDPLVGT